MKGFTAAELAEMRADDEEIDREFDAAYAHSEEQKLIDQWVDELVKIDTLDARTLHRKNKQDKYAKAYYESHKDELAAKMKAYRESHKDELAAKMKAYYESHKDELAAKMKAYRESHKDELAAKKKAYYESHKEQLNAYQRKYYQKSKSRKQHILSDKIQKEAS